MATTKVPQIKTVAKVGGDYVQTINPEGYLHNREITNLPGQFLVQGSINCFIKNAEKVVSRNGHTLLTPAQTSSIGCNGGFDWLKISSGPSRNIKQRGSILEVLYGTNYIPIYTLPGTLSCSFETWWSSTELIDFLIFGQHSNQLFEWSGAVVPLGIVSTSSLTKQKYISGNDITFTNNGLDGSGNPIPDNISKPSGGFVSIANFQPGDIIVPSGTVNNNSPYLIKSLTDTVLVIDPNYNVTTEAAGAIVVIQLEGGSTWAAARAHTANAGDVPDRAFNITANGMTVKYTYSGGETTGTLTGVSPSPIIQFPTASASFGIVATQTVRTYSTLKIGNTGAETTLTGYSIDIVWVVQNQIVLGSFKDQRVLISRTSDFTDYGYSTPLRLPGEGAVITLGACPTAFSQGPYTISLTAPSIFYISATPSSFYRVTFYQQSQTDVNGVSQIYETTPCQQIPSGTNSAAVSEDAIVDVKGGQVYVSFEPSIETLADITSTSSAANPSIVPLSDAIKDDIESYDLTGIQGVYCNRALWYTIPEEGLIISYDYVNKYWQPPQTGNFSRLTLIEINGIITLCGHAADSNETYILFDGYFDVTAPQIYTDEMATIKWVAAFGYENYGSRFNLKRFDEMATELYITPSTIVHDDCYLDYGGSTHINNATINIIQNPQLAYSPVGNAGEGQEPEGYSPEGSTTDTIPTLIKARIISDCTFYDFFERQRVFWSDTLGGHAEVIAYGENIQASEELPTWLHV